MVMTATSITKWWESDEQKKVKKMHDSCLMTGSSAVRNPIAGVGRSNHYSERKKTQQKLTFFNTYTVLHFFKHKGFYLFYSNHTSHCWTFCFLEHFLNFQLFSISNTVHFPSTYCIRSPVSIIRVHSRHLTLITGSILCSFHFWSFLNRFITKGITVSGLYRGLTRYKLTPSTTLSSGARVNLCKGAYNMSLTIYLLRYSIKRSLLPLIVKFLHQPLMFIIWFLQTTKKY